MVRLIVSLAVLLALIVAVWLWFNRKKTNKRRGQVDQLVRMRFSVQRNGIEGDSDSVSDITSAAGRVRGYELQLRVQSEQLSAAQNQSGHKRYTTVAVRLRTRPPDLRINSREWPYGKPPVKYMLGDDSGSLAVGSPAFDDSYLLFCTDVTAARYWFVEEVAYRFAADPAATEYVRTVGGWGPGNGLLIHEGVLSLCIAKQAEQLDLVGLVNYVARLAELFDEAGDRLARVSA